jgi:glycerol-3-phosphate dehydrogenase (NAD+)
MIVFGLPGTTRTACFVGNGIARRITVGIVLDRDSNHSKTSKFSTNNNNNNNTTMLPEKVAVVGAGSFGSAMTRMIGKATEKQSPADDTYTTISWYARRQSVVDEINTQHTNQQYFPGTFSDNIQATTDIQECVRDAKVVFLAIPTSFLPPTLKELKENASISDDAVLVSVLKSLIYDSDKQAMVTSADMIKEYFPHLAVTALSGPNLYSEMACDYEFAEATIGYDNEDEKAAAQLVQKVTSSKFFQTSLTNDRVGLEMCGGLKNVFSLAVGYMEGLGLGWNARSAVVRAGMHEMVRFQTKMINTNNNKQPPQRSTVFETSAGVGDLMLTCMAGRGRTLAAAYVRHGIEHGLAPNYESSVIRWEELEENLLNGMKLPDWHNAQYVYQALTDKGMAADFPLLEAVYNIGFKGHDPRSIVDALSKSIVIADSS